jgi:uncharacterized protein (UPF0261 family)
MRSSCSPSLENEPYEHASLATYTPVDVRKAAPASTAKDDRSKALRDLTRAEVLSVLTAGTFDLLRELHGRGGLHAVLAAGGSTTSALACNAMRALPIGLPKLCVSTMASGDVSSYVGDSDIAMMPAVGAFAPFLVASKRLWGVAFHCSGARVLNSSPLPTV